MIKILAKHLLIDKCIEIAFNNINNNFNAFIKKLSKQHDFINITFKEYKTNQIISINAHVQAKKHDVIVLMYFVRNKGFMTFAKSEDIIKWTLLSKNTTKSQIERYNNDRSNI